MVAMPAGSAGPNQVPSGHGWSSPLCPTRTLLIADTDHCLDQFVHRAMDLGVAVIRHEGPVIAPCPFGDAALMARVDRSVLEDGIRDLIVCGHSRSATWPPAGSEPAAVARWGGGDSFMTRMVARMAAARRASDRSKDAVLRQVRNLCTYRSVHRGAALGILRVHAWFYLPEVGSILWYDPRSGWVPLSVGSIAPTRDDNAASTGGDKRGQDICRGRVHIHPPPEM